MTVALLTDRGKTSGSYKKIIKNSFLGREKRTGGRKGVSIGGCADMLQIV